jgi:hypothetical protein
MCVRGRQASRTHPPSPLPAFSCLRTSFRFAAAATCAPLLGRSPPCNRQDGREREGRAGAPPGGREKEVEGDECSSSARSDELRRRGSKLRTRPDPSRSQCLPSFSLAVPCMSWTGSPRTKEQRSRMVRLRRSDSFGWRRRRRRVCLVRCFCSSVVHLPFLCLPRLALRASRGPIDLIRERGRADTGHRRAIDRRPFCSAFSARRVGLAGPTNCSATNDGGQTPQWTQARVLSWRCCLPSASRCSRDTEGARLTSDW